MPDALDHRDHGRDERRVDDEEDERGGQDRRQVVGREVEHARARKVGEQRRARAPATATEIAYCAMLKAILRIGLRRTRSAMRLRQQQARRAPPRRRRRSAARARTSSTWWSRPPPRACRPSAASARRAVRRAAKTISSSSPRCPAPLGPNASTPPHATAPRAVTAATYRLRWVLSLHHFRAFAGGYCRMLRHPHLEPAPRPSTRTTSRLAVNCQSIQLSLHV